MHKITKPGAALRLARTIASDLLLYNKDKIAAGLKGDILFELIAEELREGYELFNDRVDAKVAEAHNFVDRAIVDVLIKSSAHLPTTIW